MSVSCLFCWDGMAPLRRIHGIPQGLRSPFPTSGVYQIVLRPSFTLGERLPPLPKMAQIEQPANRQLHLEI